MANRFAEKTLRVGGKTIRLTLPEFAPETIIYLHGEPPEDVIPGTVPLEKLR